MLARDLLGSGGVVATVEELQVYQKALVADAELFALIERSGLGRNSDLVSQLSRASDRIVSNISEGFEQKTDRHFAAYLYNARGGAREVRAHLEVGVRRRYALPDDVAAVSARYEEIGRMLTGLINYLRRSDWRDRR